MVIVGFFFFKQKTAYEITYGDWSSDVCSSDLLLPVPAPALVRAHRPTLSPTPTGPDRNPPRGPARGALVDPTPAPGAGSSQPPSRREGPMFGLGTQELMVILVIALFLFGAQKLPELARGLGKSVKEFKKATEERADEPPAPAPAAATSPTAPARACTACQAP